MPAFQNKKKPNYSKRAFNNRFFFFEMGDASLFADLIKQTQNEK
jgi:hypothetical protein